MHWDVNMEICPFKGPVNVKIVSSYKVNQPLQYPVYCNGIDGTYRKTTTIEKYSDSDWAIQRVGINSANGTFKYSLHEESTIEEQNGCYECSASKQGPRVYSEKITTYADVKGLSNESESLGIKVDEGINEIFGPFTGTDRDKVLSQKNTIKRTNPINGEEETITYEFNLKKD